ncbi:MAG: T9SS type A sorting domain-containing protein [Calditrichaceae bacterium]
MNKKLLLILAMFLICASQIFAQTMKLGTYGVSPRDVVADTEDIFDRAFNGLNNVGIQTQMYLKGTLSGASLTNPTWTVTAKPSGSLADFGALAVIDTSSEVVVFTPDLAGTYKVTFSDGELSAELTINAAKYVGVYENCTNCHGPNTFLDDMVTPWEQTGHYWLFEEAMMGTASDHYGPNCVSCHTTGYDLMATNDGFDDRTQLIDGIDSVWAFPDSLAPGTWDALVALYPNSMHLARIQCESCHGPGDRHNGNTNDARMIVDLKSDNCAWCHDSGTHHVYPEQWDVSMHGNATSYPTGAGRSSCVPCHTGIGFVQSLKGVTPLNTDYMPITCAACHDPHNLTNEHQVRTVEATLSNGEVVTQGGLGKLCMNCHKSRRDAVAYTNAYLTNLSSHYGPHGSLQGDMLIGTNAVTFGKDLPSSPHMAATENACVDCHMYPGHADESGEVILSGSHSFAMSTPDEVDNVAACADCHGNVGTSFDEKKYYINGNADHDGDGTAEGLQHEVEGLLEELALLLPPKGEPTVAIDDSSVTLVEAQAGYNYFFVEEDGSFGIHNPAYTIALLKESIAAVNATGISDDYNIIPVNYALAQNYPNPFNPETNIHFSLVKSGHVSLVVYNTLGQKVATLIDDNMNAGAHDTKFIASNLSSGVYFYRLTVTANDGKQFESMKKMILMK